MQDLNGCQQTCQHVPVWYWLLCARVSLKRCVTDSRQRWDSLGWIPTARTIQMFKPTDVAPIKAKLISLSGNLLAAHLDPGISERRRAGAAAGVITAAHTSAQTRLCFVEFVEYFSCVDAGDVCGLRIELHGCV